MLGPGRFHSNLNYVLKVFCEGDVLKLFCEGDQDKFQGQRSEFQKLIENGKLSHHEISDETPLGT